MRRGLLQRSIHELLLDRRLLSKQCDDFGDVIHGYLRALRLGRLDCERFFGRLGVLEATLAHARAGGYLLFSARLRATARATICVSC